MFAPNILVLTSAISSTALCAPVAASNDESAAFSKSQRDYGSVPPLAEISLNSSSDESFTLKGRKMVFVQYNCTSPTGQGLCDLESLIILTDKKPDAMLVDGGDARNNPQGDRGSECAGTPNTVSGVQTSQSQSGTMKRIKRSAPLRKRMRDEKDKPMSKEAEAQHSHQGIQAPAQRNQMQQTRGYRPGGFPPRGGQSRDNQSRGNQSRGNQSRGNQSRGNQSRGNQWRNRSPGNAPPRGLPPTGPLPTDPPLTGPPPTDSSPTNPPPRNPNDESRARDPDGKYPSQQEAESTEPTLEESQEGLQGMVNNACMESEQMPPTGESRARDPIHLDSSNQESEISQSKPEMVEGEQQSQIGEAPGQSKQMPHEEFKPTPEEEEEEKLAWEREREWEEAEKTKILRNRAMSRTPLGGDWTQEYQRLQLEESVQSMSIASQNEYHRLMGNKDYFREQRLRSMEFPWQILEDTEENLESTYRYGQLTDPESDTALYGATSVDNGDSSDELGQRLRDTSMETFLWRAHKADQPQSDQDSSRQSATDLHIHYLIPPTVLYAFYEARGSRYELRHTIDDKTLAQRWVEFVMVGEWLDKLYPIMNSKDNLFDAEPRIAALYHLFLHRAADLLEYMVEPPRSRNPRYPAPSSGRGEKFFFARPEWDQVYRVDEQGWRSPGTTSATPSARLAKIFDWTSLTRREAIAVYNLLRKTGDRADDVQRRIMRALDYDNDLGVGYYPEKDRPKPDFYPGMYDDKPGYKPPREQIVNPREYLFLGDSFVTALQGTVGLALSKAINTKSTKFQTDPDSSYLPRHRGTSSEVGTSRDA